MGSSGLSWHAVSNIAMRATAELIATYGADRLAGVRVIGVDEHRWASRRRGTDGSVTLIIDLTPVRDGTGPARLLDLVAGRSAAALKSWLAQQEPEFREQVEVIAMDGFGGYNDRRGRPVARRDRRHGPFSRCGVCRRQARPHPPARPAGHLRSSGPYR
jgi:transposase